MKKANYKKIISNSGEIIELIGSYDSKDKEDNYLEVFENPPEMLNEKETNEIINIMKKNGIKKMDIIL